MSPLTAALVLAAVSGGVVGLIWAAHVGIMRLAGRDRDQ